MIKKLINFRSFLVIGAAMIAAITFAFISQSFFYLGLALLLVLLAGLLTLAIIFRSDRKRLYTYIAAVIFCFVAFLGFGLGVKNYANINYDVAHTVSGRADTIIEERGVKHVVLKDISIAGKKCSGKLRLNIDCYSGTISEFIRAGDEVTFSAKIYKNLIIRDDGINAYAYKTNILYSAYTAGNSTDLNFTPGQPNFLQKLDENIYTYLTVNMGENYGGIAYAMLSGDKRGVDGAIYDYFTVSGLGHLMAVSGLHIGFLCAALLFIFKKMRRVPKVIIISLMLFLYALFAGFSPSVVRAVIMCEVGLFTYINGRKNDPLNTLMLAFSLILLVRPVYLFDVGFLTSFTSVFGIVLFATPIQKALQRIKFPKFLAAGLSVSTSAQIGILPVMMYFFHIIQPLSILLNVIIIPLMMPIFIVLLLGTLLTLIYSGFGIILGFTGAALGVIDIAANAAANVKFSAFMIYVPAGIVTIYLLYFVISRFFMIAKGKRLVSLLSIFLCVGMVVGYYLGYSSPLDSRIYATSSFGEVTSVAVMDGKVYVIGDCRSTYAVKEILDKFYIKKIDAIYLQGLDEEVAAAVISLNTYYKPDVVYCPGYEDITGTVTLLERGINLRLFESPSITGEVVPMYGDGNFYGYNLGFSDSNAIFIGYKQRLSKIPLQLLSDTSIIRCYTNEADGRGRIYLVNRSYGDWENAVVYSANNLGTFGFDYLTGATYY